MIIGLKDVCKVLHPTCFFWYDNPIIPYIFFGEINICGVLEFWVPIGYRWSQVWNAVFCPCYRGTNSWSQLCTGIGSVMESIYNFNITYIYIYLYLYIYSKKHIPKYNIYIKYQSYYSKILQHIATFCPSHPLATDETQWSWRGALRSRGAGEKCVRSFFVEVDFGDVVIGWFHGLLPWSFKVSSC